MILCSLGWCSEFKPGISTHDALTYSAKARKHKQAYQYLRYGVVVSNETVVPHRFFLHNEALDFFAAVKNTKQAELGDFFSRLIEREVATSRRMERIAFGEQPQFFRSEIEDKLSQRPICLFEFLVYGLCQKLFSRSA